MKYLNAEAVFWRIAYTMPNPHLSILPFLHKKYVKDSLLLTNFKPQA